MSNEQIEDEYDNDESRNNWNIDEVKLKEMKIEGLMFSIIDPAIQHCKDKIIPSDYYCSLNGNFNIVPNRSKTKGDFTNKILSYCKSINMNNSDIVPLFQILHEYFPFSNLPMTISNNKNIILKLNDYEKSNIPIVEFDVCINSCCVFAGSYSNLFQCPNIKCNAYRFTRCKQCKRKKNYSSIINECNCTGRVANKTLNYRPIKSIIMNLLNYESFRKLIDYQYFDMQKYFNTNYKHWDIKSSTVYLQNYNEMTEIFNNKYKNESNNKVKMINIMISQFYDGCAIYRNKISSFHPLLLTILNLPPNYRFKLGVGMFNLTIFSSDSKSIVEDFLFNNLYVEELLSLYKGFEYQVYDEINNENLYFFVQVRQIQGIFDTIAAQDKLKFQSCGSLAGCGLCNSGKSKKIIKIYYSLCKK